ncbi:MAG: GNAT family N-acetyltransferase [Planctomycetaceae bacterium]|jgi:ribosomal protein S18 acetylase RimI-like enzyme|nr:GNAT family N-acetyltransferase [Planctomycetaceae bacterium]
MSAIVIRQAGKEDAPLVLQFIKELAEYEHLSDSVAMTADILADWIEQRKIEVLLAEYSGQPAGFVLFYRVYATFRARPGLYIEDLFVMPEFRKRGIGTRLFCESARIAAESNCCRIDWQVLHWNQKSIAFYEKLGGQPVSEWLTYRLTEEPLHRLAAAAADEIVVSNSQKEQICRSSALPED